MKRFRIGLILVVLLGVAGLIVLVMWGRPAERPEVVLEDGTRVILERTFRAKSVRGVELVRGLQSFFSHLVRRPSWHRWAPDGSLVIWWSRRDANGRYVDFDEFGYAILEDAHGCRFPIEGLQLHSDRMVASGQTLPPAPANARFVLYSAFSRGLPGNSKTVTLKLYDRREEELAAFEIPNPATGSGPSLVPQTLPAAREADGLRCTLLSLSNRFEVVNPSGQQVRVPRLAAQFRIERDGKEDSEWRLTDFALTDPAGNRMDSGDGALCLREPAWALEATFFRRAVAKFSPEEVATFTNFAIPGPGKVRVLTNNLTIGETRISLLGLAGPGDITYSNGVPVIAAVGQGRQSGHSMSISSSGKNVTMNIQAGSPTLVARVPDLPPDMRLSLLVRADHGEVLEVDHPSGAGNDQKLFFLRFQTNAASADLTFIIHKGRKFNFAVAPPSNEVKYPSLDAFEEARKNVAARSPDCGPDQIDLSDVYTASLRTFVHLQGPVRNGGMGRGFTFDSLPQGLLDLDPDKAAQGMPGGGKLAFDIRGLVVLNALSFQNSAGASYPLAVEIPVNRIAAKLHVLHTALFPEEPGTVIGRCVIRFKGGGEAVENIVYGRNVSYFYPDKNAPVRMQAPARMQAPVWTDADGESRLYLLTWENPDPAREIESVQWVSLERSSPPALVALTVEPPADR